jgi:hypothetical protein
MTPTLYEHQKKIIQEDKKWCGIFQGTGSGKTATCLHLAKDKTLVICPKQQREDKTWEKNAEKFGIKIDLNVVSKEEFRRDYESILQYDTVIIDEAHNCLGILPDTRQRKGVQIPKTSQIFEAVLTYIKKYPPKRFYLLSATPVSKPMHLFAIAKLFGINWNYYEFRAKYYFEVKMGQRRIWLPKNDKATKDKMAEIIKKLGYTGSLNDFFDVPDQTHQEVFVELTPKQKEAIKEQYQNEADPMVRRARIRTIENGILYGKKIEQQGLFDVMTNDTKFYPSNKIEYILQRAQEFPKLLIFANYTAQIQAIEHALKKEGYKVSTLTGQTKDRANLLTEAEKDDDHIVIAQSSISSGWEFPSCRCTIFASKSWRSVDYQQSLGRTLRANHLAKNLFIHLIIKGGPDNDCHKAIMSGQDFQERLNLNI